MVEGRSPTRTQGAPAAAGQSAPALFERMAADRVVPVVVLDDATQAIPLARAIAAGGCGLIEITLRTPAALAAISTLANEPGMLVGAGTVLNGDQVRVAYEAGARFIVSPGLDAAVVRTAQSLGLPVVPGISTASEAQAAWNLGLRVVKFFPATASGGAAALQQLAAVFRDLHFMPTGGITEATLPEYLALPQVIACGGSWLAPAALVESGDFAEITRRTVSALQIARGARR